VSVATAGAGAGATLHALAAAEAGLSVAAVASRTSQRATEQAARAGAVACTYDQLPAGADVVVVATPPATHAALALAVADAGATVVVDAPLAATLADADALVDAATRGAPLAYGENLAHAPLVRAVLELAGGLGPLRFVEVRALAGRPDRRDLTDPSWGGGATLDLATRAVGVALLLAGDDVPVQVAAALTPDATADLDAHGEVRVRFRSGLEARIEAGWGHHEVVWDLQASSDTGVVRAELVPTPSLEHDGAPRALPLGGAGTDDLLIRLGFVDQMRAAGRDPSHLAGVELGRRALEVVCAAYAAAGGGAPVALPYTGPRDLTPIELWRR
jgi:predicted dehydrogenase